MRRFINQIRHSKGFSLVEVLASSAILSIVGLGVTSLTDLSNRSSVQLTSTRIVIMERSHIVAAISNPSAWQATMAHNTSFNCVTTGGCSPSPANGGYYDFVLYDSQGVRKLTYDPADPTTRPYLHGGQCPSSKPDPSAECPIKYVAQWKPNCQSYPCANPMIEVRVNLVTNFANNQAFLNPKNYNLSVVRGLNEDTIQSACFILNGTFNAVTRTCRAKHAGRTCANQGFPHEIVSRIDTSGNITCTPLYNGQCGANELMTAVSIAGTPTCASRNAVCPAVNCSGSWSSCSATCGGGTQTYTVTQPAKYGGTACVAANGATQACNTAPCPVPPVPVNCAGSWSNCSAACGPGTKTYSITTPAANGGAACAAADGAVAACNLGACPPPPVPVNCVGAWSACSVPACGGGIQTYSITTPPANGGANCPYNTGDTQTCNTAPCAGPVNCGGYWNACNTTTGTKDFVVTQAPANGGTACPASPQSCAVSCVGSWGACNGGVKTYTVTQAAMNGGASCPYSNGATDPTGCAPPAPPPAPIVLTGFCFVAGTQVTMKDGTSKSIEDVEVGEQVVTFDEAAGKKTVSPVTEVFHHEEKPSILYTFSFGENTVTSNDIHRFYVPRERAYRSAEALYARWLRGENIELQSESDDQPVQVRWIQRSVKRVPLYNLHVQSPYDRPDRPTGGQEPGHNYYANGVLVHNVKWGGCLSMCSVECDAVDKCCGESNCQFSVGPGGAPRATCANQAQVNAFWACYGAGPECPHPDNN